MIKTDCLYHNHYRWIDYFIANVSMNAALEWSVAKSLECAADGLR